MQCIVYVSSANEAFNGRELHALADKASEHNRRKGVTGYLFYQKKTFIQYIEGDGSALEPLMLKIASDKRHEVVFQMAGPRLEQRRFPNWGMRYITPQEIHEINLERMLADELNLVNIIGKVDETSEERVWRLVDLIAKNGLNIG